MRDNASERREGNRILLDKKAGVELLNPWQIAFELKHSAGVNSAGVKTKKGPERANFLKLQTNLASWNRTRTFFKENQDVDI